MTKPAPHSSTWKTVSVTLAVLAIAAIIVEPFPKGPVLVSITEQHGIDAGDIPAIVVLLAAIGIAVVRSRRSTPQRIDD